MLCPECKTTKVITLETRQHPDGSVFRRRGCKACGHLIRTLETIVDNPPRPPRNKKRKPGPRKGVSQLGLNRALGENNSQSVLTTKDVIRLRQLAASGTLQKDIAISFGISKETVSRIVNRKLWSHVP